VDQLLLEAGLDGDSQLRPALLELQALGSVAPEPSAELLALMGGAGTAAPAANAAATTAIPAVDAAAPTAVVPVAASAAAAEQPVPAPVDELAARRKAKRRIALTTLSVAISLGAGGAVAAASDQGIRESFHQLNQAVTTFITGSAGAGTDDQAGRPAPLPTLPAATAPTAPGNPASVPAAPATQPAGVLSPEGAGAGEAPGQQTSPGIPGEVPAPETLPGDVSEHISNGLGKSPEVTVPTEVPLPGTLPAVPRP
jgi:hypothetical protein